MSDPLALLWWLLVAHAVADFALQNSDMAKGKNRNRPIDPATIPPGQTAQRVWPYFLTSHAVIHGGAVSLATGVWWLGVCEAVAHWWIDFGKCDGVYGIHVDQALHIACKLVWWGVVLWM